MTYNLVVEGVLHFHQRKREIPLITQEQYCNLQFAKCSRSTQFGSLANQVDRPTGVTPDLR
jgi:hypothetical protein